MIETETIQVKEDSDHEDEHNKSKNELSRSIVGSLRSYAPHLDRTDIKRVSNLLGGKNTDMRMRESALQMTAAQVRVPSTIQDDGRIVLLNETMLS